MKNRRSNLGASTKQNTRGEKNDISSDEMCMRRVKVEEPDENELDGITPPATPDVTLAVPLTRGQKRRLGSVGESSTDRDGAKPSSSRRNSLSLPRKQLPPRLPVRDSTTLHSSSRESSVTPIRSVSFFSDPANADGKMKGTPLERKERDTLEFNSYIHYAFPRFTDFTDRKRIKKMQGLVLDLMMEGEVFDEAAVADKDYKIDSILAVDNNAVLIDWEGYFFPTWHCKHIFEKGTAFVEYNRRQKMLDHVLKNLIKNETLESMRKNYPNMCINQTLDYNQYVKHPGIVYLSGLRKRERQINDHLDFNFHWNSEAFGPNVIVEDWTNFENSSIPTFQYLLTNELTDEAAEVEKELMYDYSECKCVKSCDVNEHCACLKKANSKIAYIKKSTLGNTVVVRKDDDKEHSEKAPHYIDLYECGDSCPCHPNHCLQRVMQRTRIARGHHTPKLIVFRDQEKGWILRTADKIEKGSFVIEYVGVMMTSKEAGAKTDQTYQLEIEVKTKSGRNRVLVLDARHKGNECRFISHSCDPNLFTFRVHYDVAGQPKRHIGLFASRDIAAGEELTFDYYPKYPNPEQFAQKVTFQCKCNTDKCRSKAYRRIRKSIGN